MPRSKPMTLRAPVALGLLRIGVGVLFLIFAQYKVLGSTFTHGGGFEGWIHRFITDGAAYPFMVPVLQHVVLPYATAIARLVAYGELAIGIALSFGVMSRVASGCGLVYMLTLLAASNYPGAQAPLWQYFGASLDHLVLAMCFATFALGDPDEALSAWASVRHRLRPSATVGLSERGTRQEA